MSAFNAGEITLMDVDLTGSSDLGSSGRYEVWDYNTTQMLYLGFNAQQGLCRDADVRRAIAQAVDRQDVVDSIFARHGTASAPAHPPGLPLVQRRGGRGTGLRPRRGWPIRGWRAARSPWW